jgi:hypothetical protein
MEFAMTEYRSRPDILVNSITGAKEPADGNMEAAIHKSAKPRVISLTEASVFHKGDEFIYPRKKGTQQKEKGGPDLEQWSNQNKFLNANVQSRFLTLDWCRVV